MVRRTATKNPQANIFGARRGQIGNLLLESRPAGRAVWRLLFVPARKDHILKDTLTFSENSAILTSLMAVVIFEASELMTPERIQERKAPILASMQTAYGATSDPQLLTNLFAELSSGRIQAWELLGQQGGKSKELGLLCTRVLIDKRRERRSLYIELIQAKDHVSQEGWASAFETLEDFAKRNNCAVIEGDVLFDENGGMPRMLEIAKDLGFQSACTRMLKEI